MAWTTWNSTYHATPGSGDSAALGCTDITTFKKATLERIGYEHVGINASGTLETSTTSYPHGHHRTGSAMLYYAPSSSTPTTKPDGVTALNSNDYGRLWYRTDMHDLYVYTATGFIRAYSIAIVDYSATSTIVGWSSYITKFLSYCRIGNIVFVYYHFYGTSNSTEVSFTLPYTVNTGEDLGNVIRNQDNTTTWQIGYLTAGDSTTQVRIYPTVTAGSLWTASNYKRVNGHFNYYTNDAI